MCQKKSYPKNKTSCMKVFTGINNALCLVATFYVVLGIDSSAFKPNMLATSSSSSLIIGAFISRKSHSVNISYSPFWLSSSIILYYLSSTMGEETTSLCPLSWIATEVLTILTTSSITIMALASAFEFSIIEGAQPRLCNKSPP